MPEESSNADISAAAAVTRPAFGLGETVWSSVSACERGMITAIVIRPSHVGYQVVWASEHSTAEREYEEIELSRDPLYQQATR